MDIMTNFRIIAAIAATILCGLLSVSTSAQVTYTLRVDSVTGIPDTIHDGQTVDFTVVFTNETNLGFQGHVHTVLYFPSAQDTTVADSSFMNANFLAANAQEQIFVSHLFAVDDNGLSIGDNVVVVWPRIEGGPSGPPQEVLNPIAVEFYLAPPLSAPSYMKDGALPLRIHPNPAIGEVQLTLPLKGPVKMVHVVDMTGRALPASVSKDGVLDIRHLPAGIYTVHAQSATGSAYRSRLMVK